MLGVEKDRGGLAPGKLADMVLADGDPPRDMSHIRRVRRTLKGGQVVPATVPFPEGVRVGPMPYGSGQFGNVPGQRRLVDGGLRTEARQTLENICTVMLADMADGPAFNQVWREFFGATPLPARSAPSCNGLALGARVEIECIAAMPD